MLVKTAAVTVCAAAALSACSGLEFEQDRRLSFTSPAQNKLTRLPVTLSWTMKDAPGGSYAVFLDQAPIKIGQTLQAKMTSDRIKATPALLAVQNVYQTTTPSLTITRLPAFAHDSTKRQRHTAVVVLLDASGARSTESAWTRSFDLSVKVTS